MANLHYMTLRAAVSLYAALHIAGKSEDEVKDAIRKDEKKYNEEAVNEIYAAILKQADGGIGPGPDTDSDSDSDSGDSSTTPESQSDNDVAGASGTESEKKPENNPQDSSSSENTGSRKKKYLVIAPFRDRDDFDKKYEEGDDVSHFDVDRIKSLIELKLIKKV